MENLKPKFTPGPWRQIERGNKESEIPFAIEKEIGTAVLPIADVCFNPASKEEIRANAQLIAAATEMYEAIKGLLIAYELLNDYEHEWEPCTENEAVKNAIKALAKATADAEQSQ